MHVLYHVRLYSFFARHKTDSRSFLESVANVEANQIVDDLLSLLVAHIGAGQSVVDLSLCIFIRFPEAATLALSRRLLLKFVDKRSELVL